MSRERIGVFMDAFDPVHFAHLQAVRGIMNGFKLERIYFVPSGDFSGPMLAESEDRWMMTVAFCAQDSHWVPLQHELNSTEKNSTESVLAFLQKEHPEASFYWLFRSESSIKLPDRRHLKEISSMCTILLCKCRPSTAPCSSESVQSCLDRMKIKYELVPVPAAEGSEYLYPEHGLPQHGRYRPLLEFCRIKGLYGLPVGEQISAQWISKLFSALKPHRFLHSLSVAEVSARLAKLYGLNQRQAEQAGLLHDCAKCLPLEEMRRIAVKNNITDDPSILSSGALLHSLVSAWLAEHEYGMRDPEVLEAIAYHNTGHVGMSRLSMCVCLADSIEPTRESYPYLEKTRKAAEVSLENALLMSLQGTADFVHSRGKFLHPRTQETIIWLKNLESAQILMPHDNEKQNSSMDSNLFSCWTDN